MKGAVVDRTKVVLRHLPPSISRAALAEQIDGRFAGRYNWFSLRSGKNSLKCQPYSTAYINFDRPEDVMEFAEFFDGHVFVNEKGTQFKTIVEYAPSQRVPNQSSKKDGREGTILKDPEYLEFLEIIGKPVENLPSAEIQLERREAERGGVAKDSPIITPLMDFVRQKRAAKVGSRRSLVANGRPTRRASGAPTASSTSPAIKRGSERRRISSTMYVVRETVKGASGKEKLNHVQVAERDGQLSEKSASSEVFKEESVVPGTSDIANKKILLLKGKEKEIIHVSSGLSQQQGGSSLKTGHGFRQNQGQEARIVRGILLNKDSRQSQSSAAAHSDHQFQDKDKRPPRPPNVVLFKESNGSPKDKLVGNELHGSYGEKQERRTRYKDRPDRGVWTPMRRSDGSHGNDESLSSSASQSPQVMPDSVEGTNKEARPDLPNSLSGEVKHFGSGRRGHSSFDNGSYRYSGRRGPAHSSAKDADGYSNINDGKQMKRGVPSGYGFHEKQVWVQKATSGS